MAAKGVEKTNDPKHVRTIRYQGRVGVSKENRGERMKRKAETIVLVLIIAALTAYLVLRKKEKTHYLLPELPRIDREEITRITIRKSGSELTLKRDGDRWRILPEGYPVDGAAMDRMLKTIGDFRLTAMASASENYAVYDLQEGERLQVTAFKGEDHLLSIGIGKAAPSHRHTFVKLADDSRVYHAEKNLRITFDKEAPALRDKQVMKIDEEVSEIILTAGKKSLHILRVTDGVVEGSEQEQAEVTEEKAGEGAPRWETREGKPVQEKEIDSLVNTLSNLKCDGYLEDKKSDLGDPTFSVSLKGNKNYEFSLYGERDGKTVATSSENEDPFLIADWNAKRIKKELDQLVVTEG
jgi:hypothetical protein